MPQFFLAVTFAAVLPINPVTVVAADGFEVAKPARLIFLRRIHAKLPGAHVIEKVPNLRDHVITYLLPLVVADNPARLLADSGVVHRARAMQAFVAALIPAADDVVTTDGDRIVGKYQTLQR